MDKNIKKLLALLFIFSYGIFNSAAYYFETPKSFSLSEKNCYYPFSLPSGQSSESVVFWEEADEKKSQVSLYTRNSRDGYNWTEKKLLAEGITFYETPHLFYSCTSSKKKQLCAVLKNENEIEIYTSEDSFNTTKVSSIKDTTLTLAAPRLYTLSNGNFILFVSSSSTANSSAGFIIKYSLSKDGLKWSPLKELNAASSIAGTGNPIVPVLAAGKKSDLLVFMVQYHRENLISLQLYACTSKDGASSWSQPVLITGSSSFENGREDFYNFSNQAPSLAYDGSSFILAWERSASGYTNSDIYTMLLSENGTVIPSSSEKLSTTGFCSKPVVFNFDGTANIIWFTNQNENKKVFLSQKHGNLWNEAEIISESNSTAAYPVISDAEKNLAFIWEKFHLKTKASSIEILTWDHSVNPPMLKASDFKDGQRSSKKTVSFKITHAADPSGIKGCSWIVTQNPSEEPPAVINADPSSTDITAELNRDGLWFIKVRECDYAGNWSASSRLTYTLDTVPPGAVSIIPPEETEEGLLPSNTFSIQWDSPRDEDVSGYIWTIKKIDDIPQLLIDNKFHRSRAGTEQKKQMVSELLDKNEELIEEKIILSGKINSSKNSAGISNLRNGLYVFAVTAVDSSGNISEASDQIYFILNKYNPFTAITELKTSTDEFGDTAVEISGTGFTYDGTIKEIYIDEDGRYPYDYTLKLDRKDYKVLSNYKITEIELSNIKSGTYQVGLFHTDRGLYFSGDKTIFIKENGTIKNKIAHVFKPLWKAAARLNEEGINIVKLLAAGLSVLAAVWFAVCLAGLISSLKESIKIKEEVHALIEGDIMPEEKKSKAILFSHKGKSLKSKLILNTTLLIAIMDILIFITIGVYIIHSQKRILSQSLSQRVNVMLDSLSRGAKIYLPLARKDDQMSIADLSDITNQVNALNEARYATMTGFMTDENGGSLNTVWATNDENINSKINDTEFENGTSRLTIPELNEIFSELLNINEEITKESRDINNQIRELLTESYSLAGKIDSKSSWRRSEIQTQKNQLLLKLNSVLDEISEKHSGSYPVFDSENINEENTTYIFYKPILYRQDNDNNFVHGTILIEVSTKELLKTIQEQRNIIFQTGLLLLVVAIILAFISTYILASRITKPIIELSSHVAMIRDTADKTLLSGKTIKINTKDEIGILGDTVNEMTEGLAEAAVQAKNLTLGKDIQTKFIPLQTNEAGATLSTGKLHADGADFFSFYSGADDLSGDYFDYKKLDESHYAIIKCDVSGHGVPAALIMVEVATLFLNYFQKWDMKNPRQGTNLSPVVGQINDLLESRGFKGRFAAFTLCIMNTITGECWFCNAGDNLIQIYDNAAKMKKTISLQETPAAGMFSTDLIEMKGGYQVTKVTLNKGDVLFLYTDGIEEAKRNFRNENGETVNSLNDSQSAEETNEELSAERVSQIIEAVYAKSRYTLIKHNADKNEELHFDFSTCTGTAEDAIMALVSVEKAFRMYCKKNSKPTDHVKADKNIDAFLREHFNEYTTYCSAVQEVENDSTSILYKGILEDPQYDDLTLIGIRKL
ncbi:HAMP domain-containing protein [Treponema rectale]|uniref:HAMP domain-containing protein n=1 Tax=Treponema rectale TaxID=744512 RepID=A0A840SF87_9SPIR|nr:SpoIIE family protein phosphatase [Treponema rectale]MBB5218112.1 serine phosphatase RsbU (regulator of sigma subunit) [Treponema rectale]QOS40177.1 HAMP domain-containing protein [Treponema rectale]